MITVAASGDANWFHEYSAIGRLAASGQRSDTRINHVESLRAATAKVASAATPASTTNAKSVGTRYSSAIVAFHPLGSTVR